MLRLGQVLQGEEVFLGDPSTRSRDFSSSPLRAIASVPYHGRSADYVSLGPPDSLMCLLVAPSVRAERATSRRTRLSTRTMCTTAIFI